MNTLMDANEDTLRYKYVPLRTATFKQTISNVDENVVQLVNSYY